MIFRILSIAVPFVWFGAVAAISFMEAPLKFSAPGVTIPLGLGIGQLVFHMLNRIEIFHQAGWPAIADIFRHRRRDVGGTDLRPLSASRRTC